MLSHAHHDHQNLLRLRLAENFNKNAPKNAARTYKIHRRNALCRKQQNPTVSRVKIRTLVEQPPVLEAGSRSSAPSIKRYNAPFAEPVRSTSNAYAAFSFRGTFPDCLTFLIRGRGYKERVTSNFDFRKFTLITGSNPVSSASLRCDHGRAKLGFRVHHYWRMRFCSANCVGAY